MDEIKVSVASWNQFLTTNFVIVPELVGSEIVFNDKPYRVKISLPSKQHILSEPLEGNLLSFNTYKEVAGEKKPVKFWVHAVDIRVDIPQDIHVPQAILDRPPNAYDILSIGKQSQLDQLASTYTQVAEEAFGMWIRVLRWKSNNSSIGRPRVLGHESGWSTYLVAEATNNRIWAWQDAFRVPSEPAVTSEVWHYVGKALKNSIVPPVYIELLYDGIEHMELGDFQRAIVDMAISCEAYLRRLVTNSLPHGVNHMIVEFIDEANIRPVLTKFVPEILDEEGKKRLKKIESDLHSLFDIRNKIVHAVKRTDINYDDCQKYLGTTRKLFMITSLAVTDLPNSVG